MTHRLIALACLALIAPFTRAAPLRLAPIFTDHAVLQRDKPLTVWGDADANTAVDVNLGATKQSTQSDSSGHWRVTLPPTPATTDPQSLSVTSSGATTTIHDLLIGEVWICAGQSNMAMNLRETDGGPALAADAAQFKHLRLFTVPKHPAADPQTKFEDKPSAHWLPSTPDAAAPFAAVGFYFGTELLKDPKLANVPIGLIDCSVGGTAAEAWTSKEALAGFQKDDLLGSMFGIGPSALFNAMVAPLAPYAVRGVVWYQGESNAGKSDLYPSVLTAMITDWRHHFGDDALPFLLVQLPAFVDPPFVWIREAEAKVAQSVPNVAYAVTIDTTDGYDLHPKQKHEVGRRLSLLARNLVYKEADVVATGPAFKDAKVEDNAIRVTFDTPLASHGDARGFALAGDDGVYHFATAALDGPSALVRCDAVPHPKTVRYAFTAIPDATLTNSAGLPAAPFRTDTLPRSTVELTRQPTAHRVNMPAYEIEINGDGRVTSLGVRGKQFLSNALGVNGGTSIPFFFGNRNLANVRELGPTILSCADNEITLELAFADESMIWTLTNHGKGALNFRLALATKVTAKKSDDSTTFTLTRDKSALTATGFDKLSDAEDGKMLEVKVDGGQTKQLTFTIAPAH